MASSLPGFDNWLVQPYEDAAADTDRFWTWAEEMGYELEDPADLKKAEDHYLDYLADQDEERRIGEYEDAMDRKYEERQEREWDDRY